MLIGFCRVIQIFICISSDRRYLSHNSLKFGTLSSLLHYLKFFIHIIMWPIRWLTHLNFSAVFSVF